MMTWMSGPAQSSRPRCSRTSTGSISSRPGAETTVTAGSRLMTAPWSSSSAASTTASASAPGNSSMPTCDCDVRVVISDRRPGVRRLLRLDLLADDLGALDQRAQLAEGDDARQVDEAAVGGDAETFGRHHVEACADP